MNDFDYDCRLKKRIAINAKRNTKYHHGGCRLPQDYLTEAQIKRRNGEMVTYNIKQPMTWKQFKAMPHDIQQQYIDFLQDEFHAAQKDIAENLFYVSVSNLCKTFKRNNLKMRNRLTCETDRFSAFVNGAEENSEEEEQRNIEAYNTYQKHKEESRGSLQELNVTFSGVSTWEELFALANRLPINKLSTVQVIVR